MPAATSTPWPNFGRGRTLELRARSLVAERAEAHHDPQAGRAAASSRSRNGRQASRSAGQSAGWPGGAHLTAEVTQASRSSSPSPRRSDVGWLANPARCIARYSQSPDRSPVNMRPVRLAPWAAGARPSTIDPRPQVAEARAPPAPSTLVAVRRPLRRPPTSSRQATRRGQARQAATSRRQAAKGGCRHVPVAWQGLMAGRPPTTDGSTAARQSPPPTLVLLVRHGQTPTTGKLLPGRAKGLHLADTGRAQAQAAAERIAALERGRRRRGVRLAAGAHPRDRGADRQGRGSAGADRPWPARMRLRRVDRRGAEDADEAARVAHRAARTRRRSASPAARASPRCRPGS